MGWTMPETRRKISLRLPPDVLDAGRDRAREEDVSLTALIEAALVERLQISPVLTDPRLRLEAVESRLERLERIANREGVV